MASVFTKIINGELPCTKVYEDGHVIAFLALHQVQLGHTLVVPKIEVDHFIDVPEPFFSAVMTASQRIGRAIHKATQCKRVGSIILGWDVPHFHYHLIPMNGHGDIDFSKARIRPKDELDAIQKKIISYL